MSIDEIAAMKRFGELLTKSFERLPAFEQEVVLSSMKQMELDSSNEVMLNASLHEIKYHYQDLISYEEICWRRDRQLTITRPLIGLNAGDLQWMSTGHMRIDAFYDEMQRMNN